MMIGKRGRWTSLSIVLGAALFTAAGCSDESLSNDEVGSIESDVLTSCTVSLAATETSVVLGNPIHFTATASCPVGTPEVQLYQKINNVWQVVSAYSTTLTVTFDSSSSMVGVNNFYASVRKSGAVPAESPANSNIVNVTVADNVPQCTSVKMTAPSNPFTGQANVPMTLTAVATCPAGVVPEYQFWYKLTSTSTYTIIPGYTTTNGSWTPPAAGSYNLTAVARAQGAHVTYQVRSMAIVGTITAGSVNHPPVANADTLSTFENVPASISVIGNDTDQDGDTLTVTAAGPASHGTVTFAGGNVTYTPAAGYVGPDSFPYSISDGHGGTASSTVAVTVTDRNPIANTDTISGPVHTAIVFDPTSNDTDPDGDAITVIGNSAPAHGTVSFTGNSGTYTPDVAYAGTDSFTYTISDGLGGMATGTVNVTIVDTAPVAGDDSITTPENTPGSVDAGSNDSDADNDGLTYAVATGPSHGTASFTGSTATYTPAAGYVGADSFTYTATDPYGLFATATINVTVTNQAPIAVDDVINTSTNTPGSVDVLANDSDPNGDTLSVTGNSTPAHGAVSFSGGVATYTPTSGYAGPDSFTYTISDGNGGTATATVNVTVGNAAPVAVNDTLSTNKNTPGSVDVLANDTDANGDTLSVTGNSTPAHGTVSFSGGVATYTPALNYTGADSFTYTISDGHGGTATATVNVTVNSVAASCTITIATTTPTAVYGANIHIDATASCTTGPAQVQFYRKDNSTWTVVQPYSATATLDIAAQAVGSNQFYALARTQGTTTPVATSNTITVTVSDNVPSCTNVKVTQPAMNSTGTVGTPITLAASASCGGATPEFQFWVKQSTSSSYTVLPGYTQTTSTFTPPAAATWNIKVVARAVGAHVQYSGASSAVNVVVSP
jgi:large repetitive protein